MATPIPTPLGDRLRHARNLVVPHLSARALAKLADTAEALIGMIEAGAVQNPRLDTIKGIARVLGVTLDWLMSGTGPAPKVRATTAAVERARAAVARPMKRAG